MRHRIRVYRSPLRSVPGPRNAHWVKGNFVDVPEENSTRLQENPKLLALDPVAISYILQNDDTFQKQEFHKYIVGSLTGNGLIVAEGSEHRKQRKVMNPAFEKSLQLREIWADLASKSSRKDGRLRLDACSWLNKVTLDIIGLAGFNYAFNSLHSTDDAQNPIYVSFRSVMSNTSFKLIYAAQVLFPIFRSIPTPRSRAFERAFEEIRLVGSRLIEERKAAVLAERSASGSSVVEKQDVQGNDLLSLLVKSAIAADIPETNLRAELRTCPTDSPTLEQLNTLSYLELVIRESLRLYDPVPFAQRVATHDVVIPLQKPFTDKHGVLQNNVRIGKGDHVIIPIRLVDCSTEVWGEDANEFRPERWENLPETVHGFPSVYGHLSTFMAGPRACIGYRFTVAEIKALLFTLVRAFEFELALPADDIVRKPGGIGHPMVASNPAAGRQLPLLIKPANMD
ncbi:cytochrome P450 [Lactifluus volemus]|nr:cytochrome P450 [Lactifluus volemus]